MVSTIIRVIASQDLQEIAVKLVDIVSDIFFLTFVFKLSLLSGYALIIVSVLLQLLFYNFCFVSFPCFCKFFFSFFFFAQLLPWYFFTVMFLLIY